MKGAEKMTKRQRAAQLSDAAKGVPEVGIKPDPQSENTGVTRHD